MVARRDRSVGRNVDKVRLRKPPDFRININSPRRRHETWSVHGHHIATHVTDDCIAFTVFALLLPTVILIHLLVAPYTKVEESFHVQATHDILVHGFPSDKADLNRNNYDHFAFPGAVPRTAVGAAVLAKLSYPMIAFSSGLRSHIPVGDSLNGTVHEQLGDGSVLRSTIDHHAITKLSGYIPSLSEGVNQQILGRRFILQIYESTLTFYSSSNPGFIQCTRTDHLRPRHAA